MVRPHGINGGNIRYENDIQASVTFPDDSGHSFCELDSEERLLIDYYTDDLFVPQKEIHNVYSVVFPWCRLYCDVERLINDPLEEYGLGICYSRTIEDSENKMSVRRSFDTPVNAFNHYVDYHSSVSKKLNGMGDGTLLIDCHSFSSIPNLLNSNPSEIDICIGYNDDMTCPDIEVINNIVRYFEYQGYRVGINRPFSNSKTFFVLSKYHSVMIEINKSIYMDEYTLTKKANSSKLKYEIQSLYEILLE